MRPVGMGTTPRVKSIRVRAFALIAAVMLLALSLGAGTALADGGRHGSDVHNTFTKWITTYPAMAGVVGGEVGRGSYAGEILTYTPGLTTVIEAMYHFNGSRHSFTARVRVEQTGDQSGSKAMISGVVTDGWLKGNPVEGKYTQITCQQASSGACFQGTLDILGGSGD